MSQNITAIIPVRAGSKRLPNKNILPFGTSTLLEHKIKQLKALQDSGLIQRIVVSSDSKKMLAMAQALGVDIHIRDIEFADEVSKSFSEVVVNVLEAMGTTKHIMWSPCVCPLCGIDSFTKAIEEYMHKVVEIQDYDSVISVVKFQQYLWDSKKPINYILGKGHVPSQKLPHYQVVVNGFYLAPREKMLQWEYLCGTNPYRLELSQIEGIDIDTEFDYMCAQMGYKLLCGG